MTDEQPTPPPHEPDRDRTVDHASDPDATIPAQPIDPDATIAQGATPLPDQERPGTMIGAYKLVQPLGEGGFGTVYLAEQFEPVKRRVALKIIKLGMDTREVIARFAQEKQALALMDHPGIAKVFDAGSTATGRPYFVMELVEGVPVTEYCDLKRLRTQQRLRLFAQICAAVQHAHQKGVIHRDIKPSNVLVTEVAGKPVPKVIDFGIAKATDARLTEQTIFTQAAHFVGTPAYMSPEQAGAGGQDIDTRSDIYALGVLLYEMLTGATPFDAAALRGAGYAEIQRIIREDDPPRPSTRVSRLGERQDTAAESRGLRGPQLVKRLRGELDWIVMKCLEKDRARRYETANGLARDVERFLANEPVVASPPSRTYRLKKLVVRNRTVFAAGAAMVLLLAAGVVGTGVGLVRARRAERAAVSEAAKATQVSTFLVDMLAGVGPSVARGRDTEMLEEILSETDAKVGEELADQPEVQGVIRSYLATTYRDLGRLEQSKEQFIQARDLLIAAKGEFSDDVARQYNSLGLVHEALQEFDEAEASEKKALEIWDAINDEPDSEHAMGLVNLANLYVNIARYDEAEPIMLRARDQLRALHPDGHEDLAICLNSLGNLMQHLRRYNEAGPFYEEALAMHKALLGDDHPYVITDIANLGWLALNTEDLDGAAARFAEAVALSRRVYQEPNPNLIHAINSQATVEQKLGHDDQAEALFRECVSLAEQVYGPDHAGTADEVLALAKCLSQAGRPAAADSAAQRAIAIHEKVFGPDNDITLRSRYNYAYEVYDREDYDKAIPLLRESVDAYTRLKGRDSSETVLALNNLGRALRDAGRLDEALAPLEECRAIRRRTLNPQHLYLAVADHDLGLARYMRGELDQAQELFANAQTLYAANLDSTHRVFGTLEILQARIDLEQGRPQAALDRVAHGRPISLAARGPDHEEQVEFDVLEGLGQARLGDVEQAKALAEKVTARLDDLKPKRRALVQLHLGEIQSLSGAFGDAEKTLLAAHGVYHGIFGGRYYLTGRCAAAVAANYKAWSGAGVAGSKEAGVKVREWKGKG